MCKIQMNFLIDKKDLRLIKEIAKKRGHNSGDFVRFLIKKELSNLGLLSEKESRFLRID